MEVLPGLIFELVKISILGCVYATLLLIVFQIIGRYKSDSWFARVSKKKLRLWFLSGLFVSIGLFISMFTYWGDHGLGICVRVPIGHFKSVQAFYGSDSYIENKEGNRLGISDFTFDDDNLYAAIQKDFSKTEYDYVVWNLRTDKWKFYKTYQDYTDAARNHNYPLPNKFEEFRSFYDKHWSGWRFWLLP